MFVDLCFPQDVITNKFTEAGDQLLNTLKTSSDSWCVEQLRRAMCELSFPPCAILTSGVVVPRLLCKESCQQYVYGNCSLVYARALEVLKIVSNLNSGRNMVPLHLSARVLPTCAQQPTKSESNGSCFDIAVDFGYKGKIWNVDVMCVYK